MHLRRTTAGAAFSGVGSKGTSPSVQSMAATSVAASDRSKSHMRTICAKSQLCDRVRAAHSRRHHPRLLLRVSALKCLITHGQSQGVVARRNLRFCVFTPTENKAKKPPHEWPYFRLVLTPPRRLAVLRQRRASVDPSRRNRSGAPPRPETATRSAVSSEKAHATWTNQ